MNFKNLSFSWTNYKSADIVYTDLDGKTDESKNTFLHIKLKFLLKL